MEGTGASLPTTLSHAATSVHPPATATSAPPASPFVPPALPLPATTVAAAPTLPPPVPTLLPLPTSTTTANANILGTAESRINFLDNTGHPNAPPMNSQNDSRLDMITKIDTIPEHLPLVGGKKGTSVPGGVWNDNVKSNLTEAAQQCIVLATQHNETAAAISTMFFLLSIIEILSSAISTSVSFAQWPRTAAGVLSAVTTVVGTITAAYKFNELAARHTAANFKYMEIYNTINSQSNRQPDDRYNGPLLAEWVATVMVHLRSVCPNAWPTWLLSFLVCHRIKPTPLVFGSGATLHLCDREGDTQGSSAAAESSLSKNIAGEGSSSGNNASDADGVKCGSVKLRCCMTCGK